MGIRNYTLPEEQAEQARSIYWFGNEEQSELLEFFYRDDLRHNPMIMYRVKGIPASLVQLTLHPDRPLIKHIDITGKELDIEKIVQAVDSDLGIQLALATPSP
jgi:hypothetical protein